MTGKILLLSAICLSALTVKANDIYTVSDSISKQVSVTSEQYLQTLKPTYLTNVSEAANWGRNWFIELKGGASAFLGSPIGCGDVFDRLSPALQVGIGKWFTPAVGGRVDYQGLSFKNGEFKSMDYHFVHADFLYNLTSGINCNDLGLSRWDVIPFIGVGMIYNTDWHSACTCPGYTSGSHPFAFSYGLECRYRLANRMQLVAELSGMTTAKNFDGVGNSSRFGDNLLTLSAGLSFTLGKAGYRRIVDANPYMAQNDWLLKIEGLLDLYKDRIGDKDEETERSLYPRNDYSGLNSLRARLNNKGWDGKAETMPKAMKKRLGKTDTEDWDLDNSNDDRIFDGNLAAIKNGSEPIGASIYFFFRLGTDELTEVSQLLNIDEIARVAKKHHLKVRISGAADSATGNERINNTLSQKRAEYIKTLMIQRGIEESLINTSYEGGIDEYSPVQANRQTCVTLSF